MILLYNISVTENYLKINEFNSIAHQHNIFMYLKTQIFISESTKNMQFPILNISVNYIQIMTIHCLTVTSSLKPPLNKLPVDVPKYFKRII